MKKLIQKIEAYAFSVTFLIALLAFYGTHALRWLSELPASNEDGLKNYFTLAYHITHDHNPFWFHGMNYPHGEHLVYTDGQPLVSITLWFLDIFLPVSAWLPWLFPLILLASFFAGGGLLFKIIRGEGGAPWVSAVIATAIMFLSPQWQRLGGHYSLAHGIVIPLIIYALWKWKQNEWTYLPLVVSLFFSGFIHPYFAAMCVGLTLLYLAIQQALNGALLNAKEWMRTLAIPLSPLFIFQAVIWLTDFASDRPENPFGYLIYRATWRSLLLPPSVSYPDWAWLESVGEKAVEGSFYIGWVGLCGAVLALLTGVLLHRGKNLSFNNALFLASIPILLLSVGWPFVWEHWDRFLAFSGPLRQFRGIGRFSWTFFYAANLSAGIVLAQLWKKSVVFKVLSMLGLCLLLSEAWMNRRQVIHVTESGSSVFAEETYSPIDPMEYTAIVPLPYFHKGSEHLRTPDNQRMIEASFDLSMKTGIPLMAVHMSRTSLSQTISNLTMTRHIMELPALDSTLFGERWLLLLDTAAQLPIYQRQLISHAASVGTFQEMALYAFDADAYFDILRNNLESALYLQSLADTIDKSFVDFLTNGYYFDACGALSSAEESRGRRIARKDWTPIIPSRISLDTTAMHELTFWMKADEHGSMNTQVWFWERRGDEDVEFHVTEVGDHVIGFLNGWGLCKIDLQASEKGNSFELLLHRDGENSDLWIDDVLLRPLSMQCYLKVPASNINNRYYKLSDVDAVQKEINNP
ncbi:MAG: hypothetical protein RLP15_13645 [Cryomorphaceae bacterium]